MLASHSSISQGIELLPKPTGHRVVRKATYVRGAQIVEFYAGAESRKEKR